MPVKNDREYRYFQTFKIDEELSKTEPYTVRGYASTFEPYVLFEDDGKNFSERIDPAAFNEADKKDVIFQYDHSGPVYARTKNDTLELFVDDKGLGVKANLGTTSRARQLYEDIAAGLIDQMSFAFTVAEDHYERDTHTRVIDRIKKVYDVSAVSIPANPTTEIGISARSYFEGFIEEEKQELLEMERRAKARKRLQLKIKTGGYLNHGN